MRRPEFVWWRELAISAAAWDEFSSAIPDFSMLPRLADYCDAMFNLSPSVFDRVDGVGESFWTALIIVAISLVEACCVASSLISFALAIVVFPGFWSCVSAAFRANKDVVLRPH